MKSRVIVLQYRLLHYRTAFFDLLRRKCESAGIELCLVHGQPTATEASRNDTGHLDWATQIKNLSVRVGGRDILWQPLPSTARHCDLIILMQESRLLSNYPWLFGWGTRGAKVAFWGHGRNFQSEAPDGWRERWKSRFLTRVDWWFAYTELTKSIVVSQGYDPSRVTVLNNAIDNTAFERDLAAVEPRRVDELRSSIGAGPGAFVGLYCGSLYPDKRLDLLLAACERILQQHPDFRLVVIGDGPSREQLLAGGPRPWLHWAGSRRGLEKAEWFRAAQLFLSPGAVGLHVLDSFVSGVPMVTTVDALHGPEIAYLEDGQNGVVTAGDAASFAAGALSLIGQPDHYQRICANASECANRYTLEAMAERMAVGIRQCLAAGRPGKAAA